jgi:hypothetical protein
MKVNTSTIWLLVTLFLLVPGAVLSQSANQNRILIINGHSTNVPVIQVSGRSYVDLEGLANAVNGSLSFVGNQIALSVPLGSAAGAPAPASNSGFSRGFLNAGIEQAATLREWHTALGSAIQNGYPLTDAMLAPYRAQATTNLRLASVAVSTNADRSAFQLLTNLFQNMAKLTDRYVALRAKLTYISPDSLQNDELNQRVVACGHSLGAMAASGQYVDDGSCN